MNKQILVIVLSIVLISLISLISFTTAIYSGECMEIDLSNLSMSQDIIYIVVGNSSNTLGMEVVLNESTNNASVCFVPGYRPDNFTLVFLNKVTEEVIKEVPVSGGHSTKYIENKTIEYVEVPTYINREIFVDKEIIVEKEIFIDREIEPTFEWYYLYVFLFLCLVSGVYFWLKSINETEEVSDEEREH